MLEWREREHEDMCRKTLGYPLTLNARRICGLLKFFHTAKMRAQVQLLESLVQLWDPEKDLFNL